jgi:hypothetical protein
MKKVYFFLLSTIISALLSAPNEIYSANKTWVGNTSDWGIASNWNPAGLPNSNDDIIIPTLPLGGNTPILNSTTFTIKTLTINPSGMLTINGGTLILRGSALIEGILNVNSGTLDLNTNGQKVTVDGGTINQDGGVVSTKDMELKNSGTYDQTNGEFQISHDLKVSPGNSFNGTGGTVHFTGKAGGGANYTGNVQFHNVLIDDGADYNSDNNSDNIKISGNFINNNPDLDNNKGTVTFNGTGQQTIYTASTPPGSKTTFGNMVVSNPAGVRLLSDLGVEKSFTTNSGGYLITDVSLLYVNGIIYEGPLPVELISFSAAVIGSNVKLSWNTATEINNYGFEILRQAQDDNDNWEKIGFINGNGNSNSPKSYSFVDDNVTAGKYSYRLKQIDNDGQFEYSKTIEVDLGAPKKFELSQNYPNPFNPTTTINFNLPEARNVRLTLYNLLGQEIKTLVNEFKESGVQTIIFNGSELNSGMYIYKIESGSFTQTKKMTLVK